MEETEENVIGDTTDNKDDKKDILEEIPNEIQKPEEQPSEDIATSTIPQTGIKDYRITAITILVVLGIGVLSYTIYRMRKTKK